MSPENVHDTKDHHHFTVVFVPGGEAGKTRTISFSRWGFYVAVPVIFVVAAVGMYALIVYTPLRSLLPVSNPELERRYGGQILQIQEEVSRLVEEMNVLRSYNLRLRKALGESITTEDSVLIASHDVVTDPNKNLQQESQGTGNVTSEPAASATQKSADQPQGAPAGQEQSLPTQIAPPMSSQSPRLEFPMSKPAEGYVTRGFDVSRYHYGIDFAGKQSTAVLAAADGNVVFSGWTYDDGYMLMIAHGLGYLSVYKHNESLLKSTGAAVRRGEPVALLGNTGRTSSGPHLHFEVWKDGIAYDPGQFLLTTQ
jgi:murein DD-endopeptidase MepM/ murein hydrolase activator NlpD